MHWNLTLAYDYLSLDPSLPFDFSSPYRYRKLLNLRRPSFVMNPQGRRCYFCPCEHGQGNISGLPVQPHEPVSNRFPPKFAQEAGRKFFIFKSNALELSFNSSCLLVGSWLFCLQNLPCLVSFRCICWGSCGGLNQ